MPRLLIPIYLLVTFASQLSAQIVPFGASNVVVAGVEPQQAWPAQLEKLLKAQGYNVHTSNASIPSVALHLAGRRISFAIANSRWPIAKARP